MRHFAEVQKGFTESQQVMLEAITGPVRDPEKGLSWQVKELKQWMQKSQNNQKWIIGVAVTGFFTVIAASLGALVTAWMHAGPAAH